MPPIVCLDCLPHIESFNSRHFSARKIAIKIGGACCWNEALRIVRSIVENEDDNDLDDIIQRHFGNTKELFYQAVELAIRYKGTNLTPRYILEKFESFPFLKYTEMVEKEIVDFPK